MSTNAHETFGSTGQDRPSGGFDAYGVSSAPDGGADGGALPWRPEPFPAAPAASPHGPGGTGATHQHTTWQQPAPADDSLTPAGHPIPDGTGGSNDYSVGAPAAADPAPPPATAACSRASQPTSGAGAAGLTEKPPAPGHAASGAHGGLANGAGAVAASVGRNLLGSTTTMFFNASSVLQKVATHVAGTEEASDGAKHKSQVGHGLLPALRLTDIIVGKGLFLSYPTKRVDCEV